LLLSTPQQLHLYRTLSFPEPAYFHHPLLINEAGQRLCKRDRSLDLSALRETHKNPDEIVGFLAFWAGILPAPTPSSPQDLLPLFTWQNVPTEDITACL
jgi:glutamyl-tRNA synthetase